MRQSLSVTCASLWFSFEAPIPSINRTDHHDMNDILLKVTLKIKNHNTRSQKTLQVKLIFLWIFSSSLLPLLRKNNLIILGRNKMGGGGRGDHNVGTVPQFNRKIVSRGKIVTPPHKYMTTHSPFLVHALQ